jgi:hypothetical protein
MTEYDRTAAEIEELEERAENARECAEVFLREHDALEPAKAAAEIVDGFVHIQQYDSDEDRQGEFTGFKVGRGNDVRITYQHGTRTTTSSRLESASNETLLTAVQEIGGSEFESQPLTEVLEYTKERRELADALPVDVFDDE